MRGKYLQLTGLPVMRLSVLGVFLALLTLISPRGDSLPDPNSDLQVEVSFSRISFSPVDRPVVFKRTFGLHTGPVDGGVLIPGMRVVPDAGGRFYYGNEWNATYRIDSEEQTFTKMPPDDWPMGVTFDSKRSRGVIVTLGGEGFIYSYNPVDRSLTEIASMQGKDVDCIEYHASTDLLYTFEQGSQGTINKYDSEGKLVGEINIGTLPFPVYGHGYRAELISAGDKLVLLLEPARNMGSEGVKESRIYLIDPVAGTSEMTWRKVWDKWPPLNTPPAVRVVNPAAGASFTAGATVTFQAIASDYEHPIRSVSFALNGRTVGQAQPRTVENRYVYELNYALTQPGEFSLTAAASDYEGALTTSAPVAFTVTAQPKLTIRLKSPADGAVFEYGDELELVADVLAENTLISKVEFYANDDLIGEGVRWGDTPLAEQATYSLDWGTGLLGTHRIHARATASNGLTSTSAPVTITIEHTDDDEPKTFYVAFLNRNRDLTGTGTIVLREYYLTGRPVEEGRLIPSMRVVPDEEMRFYYGTQSHQVYQVNAETGAIRELLAESSNFDFSWPMGVAYNKNTDRLAMVTLGGEGFLYAYDPAATSWSVISSMNNLDLDSLDYDPERNSYFGASAFIQNGASVVVHELSATGARLQSITIPNATPSSGSYYTSETIDLPNGKIALFLEPQGSLGGNPTAGESRVYIIDPVAKTATLTYQKTWTPNKPPYIYLSAPSSGATFDAGSEVSIVAHSSDGDGQVVKVEFFVNGTSIGTGTDLPPDARGGKVTQQIWKPLQAGSYILTAKATDNTGAISTSTHVSVTVRPAPQPAAFTVSFAHPASDHTTIFHREYTLTGGPVGGGRLIPAMRVVPDKQKISYYGAERQEVYRINAANGVVTLIEPSGANIPELSWPMGVAFNLHTDYAFLVSLGGEGFLYAYEPVNGTWSLITSMNNLDLDSLEYDVETDGYFGTSAFLHRGYPLHVYQLSNLGKLVQTITIPDAVPATGPEYYTTETIDLPGGKVAVFVEPELHVGPSPIGGESRIYLVDPVAKTATLTYRRLWVEEPNKAPQISLLKPINGATYHVGNEIALHAAGQDSDGRIVKIEFFVNGSSIGQGVDQPTWGFPGSRASVKPWVPAEAGTFVLTAKATDDDGAITTSAPVTISVKPAIPAVTVEIIQPKNGDIFPPGTVIQISARARQVGGYVEDVQFLANGQALGEGVRDTHDDSLFHFRFSNPPSGAITLTARAIAVGATATSAPVRITVGTVPRLISAIRDLPHAYSPGTPFEVKIAITATDSVSAYAVEDLPPAGWTVTRVSHEGVIDPVSGKVKFGLFTDHLSRVLIYWVTPATDASGLVSFGGTVSANGVAVPISGDHELTTAPIHHPADSSPTDNKLLISEITAYGAAWKQGTQWPSGPNRIPLSYVTRAGFLWRKGENYLYQPQAGPAPLCWVPALLELHTRGEGGFLAQSIGGTATRQVTQVEGALQVQITVRPAPDTATYALEETPPVGWDISAVSGEAVVGSGVVRWGPFFDSAERTFTYTLTPGSSPRDLFQGFVSFDGSSHFITGASSPTSGRSAISLDRSGAALKVQLSAPAAADAIIEAADSLDADTWVPVGSLPAGGSEAIIEHNGAAQRFFRVRLLP